ncbi:MAG: Hsp20/alpha crystallin family protein [Proteobacteria bacterium]|jgi:HSP20 family protein|nr:Hsp20/alpha crystallin family protein [Pseudomonadota bacterium]
MWGFFDQRGPGIADELTRLQREMDRMLGRAAGGCEWCGAFPPVNVYDDGESYSIRAELPGVKPSDLDVQATASAVTIKGERRKDARDEKASVERRERDHGVFNRSIELATPIDADKISAKLEDGVLVIVAPKAADARPRQIKIA